MVASPLHLVLDVYAFCFVEDGIGKEQVAFASFTEATGGGVRDRRPASHRFSPFVKRTGRSDGLQRGFFESALI